MDPNACWKRIIDYLNESNFEGFRNASDDLLGWVRAGGFLPTEVVNMGLDAKGLVLLLLHLASIPTYLIP